PGVPCAAARPRARGPPPRDAPDQSSSSVAREGHYSARGRRVSAVVVRSPQHPAVKEARRLEADAAARQKAGLAIAWGRHLALEALAAGAVITRAFVSTALETDAEGRSIASALAKPVHVTSAILDGIAAGAGDQGVLLIVRRPSWDLEALLA